MSLLMEALRKAEAAKNKADGVDDDTDDSAKLSLEPREKESTPAVQTPTAEKDTSTPEKIKPEAVTDKTVSEEIEQVNFELEAREEKESITEDEPEIIEAHQNANAIADELLDEPGPEDSFDLNMDGADEFNSALPETDFVDSLEEDSEKAQAETLEALGRKVGGADELYGYIPEDADEEASTAPAGDTIEGDHAEDIFEPLEAAEEFSQLERSAYQAETSSDQGLRDRQTASSLFQAKQNTQQHKRNRAIMLSVLIALIPLGGGGFYWYYTSSINSSNMFPVNAVVSPPPEGFLGDVIPESPADTTDTETALQADVAIATDPEAATTEANVVEEVIATNLEEAENLPLTEEPVGVATTEDTPVVASAPVLTTNPQTALNTPLAGNAAPEPSVEIRLTRTTSRTEVNPDLLAAYESYQQSDLEQARRLYTQVLETQPNSRDALLGLALINRQENNIAQAQTLYSRLLQLNPRDPLARAGLLESAQNTNAAQQESQLRALQNEFPNVAPLAFALGNLFASQARWNEAQNAYFDALLIASQVDSSFISPDYAFNLAVSLERLNQLTLAYTYYQQALELSASSPAGFNMDNLNQRLAYLEAVLP